MCAPFGWQLIRARDPQRPLGRWINRTIPRERKPGCSQIVRPMLTAASVEVALDLSSQTLWMTRSRLQHTSLVKGSCGALHVCGHVTNQFPPPNAETLLDCDGNAAQNMLDRVERRFTMWNRRKNA